MNNIEQKLFNFTTTEVSDAMGGQGVMSHLIKPIKEGLRVVGTAVTIKLPFEDSALTFDAIDIAKPGDVLVMDTSDSTDRAVWGDVKTVMAIKKGIAGIVVDGAIRDVQRNRELNFPVFTKYVTPAASGKRGGGQLNVPIVCGNVAVNPGDIIFGDDNGVVVIPFNQLDDVVEKAYKKLKSDGEKIERILG